MPQCS